MKTKNKISAYIARSAALALCFLMGLIALSWALHSVEGTGSSDTTAQTASQSRGFTFVERVTYQRAIEDVYWHHRIWPKENPNPKPTLDSVMSQAQLENKVENYLRESVVLGDNWQKPITAEQLQAEVDRMARDTKQPEVLRELFEALGNDPAVIAECLARPVLAERLIADLSAQGQTRSFESLRTDTLRTMSLGTTAGRVTYTLPTITDACADDTWTATSITNAPAGRALHTAVWTGVEMIVWGGNGNTGGRYNPSIDNWTATSTTNAASPRGNHTAVWTGSKMIVWGGDAGGNTGLGTGGRYDPGTDTWESMSITNGPGARLNHTAVWTGGEMIVWGGWIEVPLIGQLYFNDGGRYNPIANTWIATSTSNVPEERAHHTAVWTGSEMVVWGGSNTNPLNTGGRYNPTTNTWTGTNTAGVPAARALHTAVWTGSEMIVWGGDDLYNVGHLNTGGRYNPNTDSWTATSTTDAPSARAEHTAVWTGTEMIVWGDGNTGGRYRPATNSWIATNTAGAPAARAFHTAAWTGTEMIVWGGWDGNFVDLNTGGRYCAQSGPTPTPTPTPNCTSSVSYDFNIDGHPDYALYKATTHQTTIWYLNSNLYVNGRYGPTVPSGWALVAVGDFNGDCKPDYVLYNATTHRTAIWYMDNNLQIGSKQGPTINARWNLVGAADFNRDGHPDYLLFDPTTHATMIYYMNNNLGLYWASGPTLNARWNLVGAADFNRDGHSDYLLFDPTTHATLIYYMNNNIGLWWTNGPTVNPRWSLVGAADFNKDGHPDYLLFDPTTHATLIYYMNNNVGLWWASGPTLTAGWSLVAP